MLYNQRLATLVDRSAIAPLWQDFVHHRTQSDPSLEIKPDFDFEQYVGYQLQKPRSYCFLLEETEAGAIVGFLAVYVYDETPPIQLLDFQENPFIPRRVGTVLGLYIKENHRQPQAIDLLINAALKKAEELKITDIDLSISVEQSGIHALLERRGFTKAAIQYTKHYNVDSTDSPSLSPTHPDSNKSDIPEARAIPLLDFKTNEAIRNARGEIVYLYPLRDETGQIIKSSNGLPIYPTPLQDPETEDWVFDGTGNLVVCPAIRDENGQIVEVDGIPQFHLPLYRRVGNKLTLKTANGQYLFTSVQRNEDGSILLDSAHKPIFVNQIFI
jgi:hypothetical protein